MKKDRFGVDPSQLAGRQFWKGPHLSRRVFFRTAAAVSGYFLTPVRPWEAVAQAAEGSPIGRAKNCILIFLNGAPSHSDTFDLKEGAWTPTFFEPTSYGDLRFPRGLMPKLAEQITSLAFVRSLKAYAGVHGLMQTWYQIGRNPLSGLSRIAPHIGSVVSLEVGPKSLDRTLPAFFSLNAGSGPSEGYLQPEHAPFYLSPGGGGLGNTAHPGGVGMFDRRYGMLMDIDSYTRDTGGDYGSSVAQMAQFNLSARKLMYNSDVDKIFNFDATERGRYGTTQFGNACITARNLLRARMGTRFVQISFGSWDHHVNIYGTTGPLANMAGQLDKGLATLMSDLRNDGLLDETLIVMLGEFGRTVGPLNSSAGRDHHVQQSVVFAGAGIRGGRAIGKTDATALQTVEPGWSQDRDVRAEDIEATIYSALGIDWNTIRRDDPFGRGFEYVPQTTGTKYYPIHELWA